MLDLDGDSMYTVEGHYQCALAFSFPCRVGEEWGACALIVGDGSWCAGKWEILLLRNSLVNRGWMLNARLSVLFAIAVEL